MSKATTIFTHYLKGVENDNTEMPLEIDEAVQDIITEATDKAVIHMQRQQVTRAVWELTDQCPQCMGDGCLEDDGRSFVITCCGCDGKGRVPSEYGIDLVKFLAQFAAELVKEKSRHSLDEYVLVVELQDPHSEFAARATARTIMRHVEPELTKIELVRRSDLDYYSRNGSPPHHDPT